MWQFDYILSKCVTLICSSVLQVWKDDKWDVYGGTGASHLGKNGQRAAAVPGQDHTWAPHHWTLQHQLHLCHREWQVSLFYEDYSQVAKYVQLELQEKSRLVRNLTLLHQLPALSAINVQISKLNCHLDKPEDLRAHSHRSTCFWSLELCLLHLRKQPWKCWEFFFCAVHKIWLLLTKQLTGVSKTRTVSNSCFKHDTLGRVWRSIGHMFMYYFDLLEVTQYCWNQSLWISVRWADVAAPRGLSIWSDGYYFTTH